MARTTPEETFAEARAAMERGDWDAVFACLVPENLLRIAENGVGRFLNADETTASIFDALCSENGIAAATLAELRAGLRQISLSAATLLSHSDNSEPAMMMLHSRQHQLIVEEYRNSLKSMIKAVQDQPRFTADLERALRAVSGGGSVSLRLFLDEVLEDVSITGTKAWATRRTPDGHAEGIGFVKRKGGWYIHLFAKPPLRN
jgi:hypothetical protein